MYMYIIIYIYIYTFFKQLLKQLGWFTLRSEALKELENARKKRGGEDGEVPGQTQQTAE